MSQRRESQSRDTAMENNSQQIGNMNFQNSNNNNIGFATHTREDNTDATSWLDNHAASSARLELPNYFQKTLLDKIVSVYQKKCLKGTFKTLVLVGAPGAGKTTLARGFIEWMFRCYNEMNYESAYMLFDHRDPAQHNARKVLLRILRWLVGHEHELNGKSYDTVQRAFAKCRPREGHEWLQTATSCVDLLLEAISPHQRKKRHFCVVLDALDEFTNDGELQTLCDQLARLQNQLNLTVVVTTRYPNQGAGKSLVRPCVEKITAEVADVRGFAMQSFAASSETVVSSLRPGAKKYEDIIDEILAKSSGIFSSVQLNVGYIASARNSDELNQLHLDLQGRRFDHSRKSDSAELVHSDIERNLRRVFGDAFELHETKLSESQQQTLHIFACVLFARRPLSMQELWAAVEVNLRPKLERHDDFNRGTELYLKTCGLIHQHDQLLTVDFAHPHLRTYLTSKNRWQNLRWRVAQSCIDYIGLPVFQQGWCPRHIYEPIISRWPFVQYAAENWHYHYGELETLFGRNPEEFEKSQRLFQSTMHFLSAPENIDFISLVMVQLGILHYPAAKATAQSTKGKEKVPTASSSKRLMASYDPTKPYGLNGLLIASLHGMSKLVDKLLDRASLQQKDQSTIKNETSAYLAAIKGDVETLRTIIRKGLGTKTLNVRDTEGFPLICRAMLRGNIAIVQELLSDVQYNVDIGAAIECEELDEPYSLPGDRGLAELTGVANRLRKYTLLHQAAVAGCLGIVTRLLELGASPDVQDGFGMTPLHKAAKYGHLEIVKLLVEEGQVDPVAKVSNDKRTALHMASKYNHEKVASYLIRKFKDLPGVKASRDQLAIHHALLAGSQGIAAMLFEMQSKTPDFVSQLETLRVGDENSASLGRRYTISLHTRSREDLSTLSPSTNNLKRRYTASEEELSAPRYNLRSAKRQYLGAARSPSAALPELD